MASVVRNRKRSAKKPSATAMSEPYQRISRSRSERGSLGFDSDALLVCMTVFISMLVADIQDEGVFNSVGEYSIEVRNASTILFFSPSDLYSPGCLMGFS